jgi:hypothetical protein
LQLIKYNHCITEQGILFKKAYRLQDAGVLFVKNVKEQVAAIYSGVVLKTGSKKEVADFIEFFFKKLRSRAKKQITEALEKLRSEKLKHEGGAFGESIVTTTVKAEVEAFETGFKQFSKKTIAKPFDKIKEAMPYFNHKSVGDAVKQVGRLNCGNTAEVVVEFLRTGKLRLAEDSAMQAASEVAIKCGAGSFMPTTIPRMKELMKEGEITVIYGVKPTEKSYVFGGLYFVGINLEGDLHFLDGQTG